MTSLPVRYLQDTAMEVGIDEAGRGCLWGPLYAAAVIWPPESEWLDEHKAIAPFIKDSKKLSAKKRVQVAGAIQDLAIAYGIAYVTAQEIDAFGMTHANKLAFTRAVGDLGLSPDRLLIDGILKVDENQLETLGAKEQVTVVEGDNSYLPIAAASILAKVSRDTWVDDYIQKEPVLETKYSIGSSKGYGTEKHRKGILAHGKHAEHRSLFLRKLLGNKSDCLITDT